jgi:hypothetical protein
MASGSVVKFRPNIGYATETLAVSSSVQVLTPSKYAGSAGRPGGADSAFITNYGNAVRYFYDGTTPDASTGHVLPDGGILNLFGQNQMSQFKCIRLSADSTITVTFEAE